ncbi:MAG TPA: Uma2 family endonuclease [Gemmatimonadaceae bacterium]|nr:Uma2 family endonuclease [Gemmatimonadota bacterium]HNV77343.1 Uma2 family endonuclease [Gemmatimonadaceae bacterium]
MPASPPLLPDRSRRDWTVDEVRALPDDGNRYEVIDGELFVTPAPSWLHQQAAMEFLFLVRPYAHRCALDCYIAPAEVAFSPRRSVEPDLFVVPRMDGRRATHFEEVQRLVLAVEVISPSSARADRYRKRHLYQSEDVPEYWIVDPDARFVERWRPGDDAPEILVESLAWTPQEDVEPLVIDLAALFRRVHGEATQ